MNQMLSLIRGLGTAGAAANARAELDVAHDQQARAAHLVERVNQCSPAGHPRPAQAAPRAA